MSQEFPVYLFVGLGNPGTHYQNNRHNIGFKVIDAFAERYRSPPPKSKFHASVSEIVLGKEQVLLIKPQTYMNESGQSVGQWLRFLKLSPPQCFVFHDELDLAAGKIRVKLGGGAAGHNGLRSISNHIGHDYFRVRLGIGHPGHKDLVHDHVLGNFAKTDQCWLEAMCEAIADRGELLIADQIATFQTKVDLAVKASFT